QSLLPSVICSLSLHDALPISASLVSRWYTDRIYRCSIWKALEGFPDFDAGRDAAGNTRGISASDRSKLVSRWQTTGIRSGALAQDRKSTRLNSSHQIISYAVF